MVILKSMRVSVMYFKKKDKNTSFPFFILQDFMFTNRSLSLCLNSCFNLSKKLVTWAFIQICSSVTGITFKNVGVLFFESLSVKFLHMKPRAEAEEYLGFIVLHKLDIQGPNSYEN